MNTDTRYTFSVMADNGIGEFLWIKEGSDDSCHAGGLYCSQMHHADDHPEIPEPLFYDFIQWVGKYMGGAPKNWLVDPWNIDWDAFNAEGTHLAVRLKQAVGDKADVQYIRPWNDPNLIRGHADLIKEDGHSIPIQFKRP